MFSRVDSSVLKLTCTTLF
uniref:Uncharacterized protein n=1 Tax=Arundo donax TaxID=35708 RepID=A0A0A8Y0M7_ARUDO